MIDWIQCNKPEGATHWQAGRYYIKAIDGIWLQYFEGAWYLSNPNELCMTTLK